MVLGIPVVRIDIRRRGTVRAAPDHEFLIAELFTDLSLILALQRTIVALIQTPAALYRDPQAVSLIKRIICRVDGAAEQRGENNIRQDILLLKELPAALCLFNALPSQGDVHPAGELVRFIPGALTMSEQY